eukprot:107345-Heterocapsa_arctica.AAC.1
MTQKTHTASQRVGWLPAQRGNEPAPVGGPCRVLRELKANTTADNFIIRYPINLALYTEHSKT